jgi:hypothetical protein
LFVEQVHFGHHRNGSYFPGRLMFFLARDVFHRMASFTLGLILLNLSVVRGVIGHLHRPAATGLGACQVFMLKGLDKTAMRLTFLFGLHQRASFTRISISPQRTAFRLVPLRTLSEHSP